VGLERRRLSRQQRRHELLDVGAILFAERPYEDVLMEDVAAYAGVTRSLLYQYFPTKRDFFTAVFRRDSDRLLSSTQVGHSQSMAEQLAAGLDAHIQYFVDHPHEALAVNRGALSGDQVIQGIIAEELLVVGRRILDSTGAQGHARDIAALAVHGWLVSVRAMCVQWVESPSISRHELAELCLCALAGALQGSIDLTATPG
jgi:AcrR family transcriptional regulator